MIAGDGNLHSISSLEFISGRYADRTWGNRRSISILSSLAVSR